MLEMGTSGLMSGAGKRGGARRQRSRPVSTLRRGGRRQGCCKILDEWPYQRISYERPTINNTSSLTKAQMLRMLSLVGADESICDKVKPGVTWIPDNAQQSSQACNCGAGSALKA